MAKKMTKQEEAERLLQLVCKGAFALVQYLDAKKPVHPAIVAETKVAIKLGFNIIRNDGEYNGGYKYPSEWEAKQIDAYFKKLNPPKRKLSIKTGADLHEFVGAVLKQAERGGKPKELKTPPAGKKMLAAPVRVVQMGGK